MKRFVLIDQSIVGDKGHFLSYAKSVLDSACENGYKPLLCTNLRFNSEYSKDYKICPYFRYTSMESLSSYRLTCDLFKQSSIKTVLLCIFKPLVQRCARFFLGSRYAYVRKIFPIKKNDTIYNTSETEFKVNSFAEDLIRFIKENDIGYQDVVFVPTISIVELRGLSKALHYMANRELPVFNVLLRWNLFNGRIADYENELFSLQYAKKSFSSCATLYFKNKIHFFTDSERLAEQYKMLSDFDFDVLPIPHTEFLCNTSWRYKSRRVISYIGDARPEKGFLLLPNLIKACGALDVEFRVQANYNIPGGEAGVPHCRRMLQNNENVKLYKTELDFHKYAELLCNTDVVLLLYNPAQYYARTSGIFAEAMSAGIPAIVPADTWMSAEICKARYIVLSDFMMKNAYTVTPIDLTTSTLLWHRQLLLSQKIVLRFKIEWADKTKSIKVVTNFLSSQANLLESHKDFLEKSNIEFCYLFLNIPVMCETVELHVTGTYEQDSPEIVNCDLIQFSDREPIFSEISVIYDDEQDCFDSIEHLLDDYTSIRSSTELFSASWSTIHNANKLVSKLIG